MVAPSAAAAPAVASAATTTTVPEMVVAASVGYLVASFVAFWLGARNPDSRCARYTRSPLPLVPLCVAYLALLVASWSPDTLSLMMPGSLEAGLTSGGWNPQFFPRLDGIMTLLSRRATSASAWMHVACINFFVGRHAGSSRRSRRMARVPHPSPHPRVRSRRLMFAVDHAMGVGRGGRLGEGDAVRRGVRKRLRKRLRVRVR